MLCIFCSRSGRHLSARFFGVFCFFFVGLLLEIFWHQVELYPVFNQLTARDFFLGGGWERGRRGNMPRQKVSEKRLLHLFNVFSFNMWIRFVTGLVNLMCIWRNVSIMWLVIALFWDHRSFELYCSVCFHQTSFLHFGQHYFINFIFFCTV